MQKSTNRLAVNSKASAKQRKEENKEKAYRVGENSAFSAIRVLIPRTQKEISGQHQKNKYCNQQIGK